jgi:hypothetical protein
MKKTLYTLIIGSSIILFPVISQAQIKDSLGLPGDNFNLYAVLNIFQQSKTLEEFETKLNSADTKVNNLDLNGDHKIDYVKVVDNMQGTTHEIVLKDEVNQNETQDVAVIEVQKDNNGKISIQIVGDEVLYGKNYIVEPQNQTSTSSAGTPNPGYSSTNSQSTTSPDGKTTIVNNTTNNYYGNDNNQPPVNNTPVYRDAPYEAVPAVVYPVATWSMWDFLFAPTYVVYASPYRWGYYPSYWNPWEPLYYHQYYSYNYTYYNDSYYSRAYTYSVPTANVYYAQRRSTSVTVVQTRTSGGYNTTYGRRDLLTKSAARGIHAPQGTASEVHSPVHNAPYEKNEVRSTSAPENNRQTREVTTQNNIEKENVQKNTNIKESQPINNMEEKNNQQRNNNNNVNKSQKNQNRSENKAAKSNSKPASKPQNKEAGKRR